MCCGKIYWKGADQKTDQSLSQKGKEQGHPHGNSGETVFVCMLQVNSAHSHSNAGFRVLQSSALVLESVWQKYFTPHRQLTCMYNHIKDETDVTSFDLFPPDVLLYYEWVWWKWNFCCSAIAVKEVLFSTTNVQYLVNMVDCLHAAFLPHLIVKAFHILFVYSLISHS